MMRIRLCLLVVITLVPLMIPLSLAGQGVQTVDLNSVISEMGRDLTYEYDLIAGEELMGCEQEWEVDIPYGVRDIVKVGDGNLLVITRSNRSKPGCKAIGKGSDDEEIVSVYSPDGVLLNRMSLSSRWIWRIYQSGDVDFP
jgi:hypothetical protein